MSKRTEKSTYLRQSETERPFDVFATFRRDAVQTQAISAHTGTTIPVLTMSSLGRLGRFGNQIFQYAFLRICANRSGARVECPPWIGQTLFGHRDAPISRRLPPAIERGESGDSLFDIIPEFVPYLEKLADAESRRVGPEAIDSGQQNVDLWGFFQLPTRLFEPHKEFFRSLFQPVTELASPLGEALRSIRSKGRTVVGIHIRRGDFITEPRTGFALVFPARWYREWLEGLWEQLDDPILFVCSDELDTVLPEFQKFSPLSWRDLPLNFPERLGDLAFYVDFFVLSKCDVVCISNSTFSFAACMLNENGKTFVRPHWDLSKKFARFDPWNSEPVLWLGGKGSKFVRSWSSVLRFTFLTQGFPATLKSMLYYLPRSHIRALGLRAYLAYQIEGIAGLTKSLLCTLGWRSISKRL